ncbi:ZIP family metal transporter [Halobaculum sp. CBA1158]|uniref:ZIP family metal transporter n=1 Tax=Halobaculum sp. CBA1158 TaxID=2904243 RepID=UPI001F1D47F3|nr:ZIP family metal transporter [Halobaculum sp. CBA1158]UIP00948.1 ZIP family metal transporter [Halobaculum sp. CBA1158]
MSDTRDLAGDDRVVGGGAALVGAASTAALVAASGLALATGRVKLFGIGWIAFAAMSVAGWFGSRAPRHHTGTLVWGYGLAAGAMITSAAVFLLPQAMGQHAVFGGFGVALGLLVGYGAHTLGHRLAHMDLPVDRSLAELTAHAVSAGAIIGIIYGNMPELGLLLGVSIVSHKGPAGYAAVHRFAGRGGDWSAILLPAAGVGVAAVASSFLALPASGAVRGVVFGFATGVFLHVAMDFLPECEIGSEVHESLEHEGDAHELLDRLRVHAVASTAVGGLAVFLAWTVVA